MVWNYWCLVVLFILIDRMTSIIFLHLITELLNIRIYCWSLQKVVENQSSADPIVAAMNTYYQQKNGDSKVYIRQNSKGYEKEMGEYG
ncbi:hypothetical protein P7E02_03660 [Enterococcus hulanensis]|uniref:hypothetical protein n=1 Tax=Enterococcus hulanensis TaxID=2559929 RepID=UPI0028922610|nr:hypothetical protein [Enterococcus hulanensis]MDT2658948.1 hypothetical protein [Enterococcus hulanensis]